MTDRSQITLPEIRALEYPDEKIADLEAKRPAIVYVAMHDRRIIGVYGKVSDAEAAVADDRESTGNGHDGYHVEVAPFFGRIWRRGLGESDE